MNFQNKNIVITGASSGIGYEMAKDLAQEGANLALLARRKNILDELADEFKSSESKILTYECDVTSHESIKTSFDFVKKEFGHIDIAILNAGSSYRMQVENFDADKIAEIFNVNVIGMVNCINELIPDFIKRKKGIIAGVSSLSDVRGFPLSAAYSSSKGAASTFLESIRVELKKYNVKVITIKPGFVKTPMTDKNEFQMPFLIEAGKASQIILNGIRKEKKIISFPFPTVFGSKLLKLLPDFIFDYLMSLPLPSKK
jgi:short-subunit dehydrogenase